MKYLSIFLGICFLVSCQVKEKENSEEEIADNVIVHEEYQGESPTEPEATEFYEPVPPKVDPVGLNGIPGDAIILFDGTSLDAWVSSSDSRGPA